MGQPVTLWIPLPGSGRRAIRGVVACVEHVGGWAADRFTFSLGIVPRLWLLKNRKSSRIFQGMSAPEIIATVLADASITYQFDLMAKYPLRDYCTQYQETDLDFIGRVCAEDGLFYRFEHPVEGLDVSELLVFGDDVSAYPAIVGDPVLIYRESSGSPGLQPQESHIQRFKQRRKVRPSSTLITGYDFQRPGLQLAATSSKAELDGAAFTDSRADRARVHDHHSDYAIPDEARDPVASMRLQQYRRRARVARGKSQCLRLVSGARFILSQHDTDVLDAEYVIVHVRHKGYAPEVVPAGKPTYRNRFECVRADVCYRLPRPAQRVIQVAETATVVGPDGQEIHVDEHGRIKVQFHWDLEGARNERSSCWIRVLQPWTGAS